MTPFNPHHAVPSDSFSLGAKTPAWGGSSGGGGGSSSAGSGWNAPSGSRTPGYVPPTPAAMDMDAPTPGGTSRAGYYGGGAATPAWGGGAASEAGDGPRYSTPSP